MTLAMYASGLSPEHDQREQRKHTNRLHKQRLAKAPPRENHPRAVTIARANELKAEWRAQCAVATLAQGWRPMA